MVFIMVSIIWYNINSMNIRKKEMLKKMIHIRYVWHNDREQKNCFCSKKFCIKKFLLKKKEKYYTVYFIVIYNN